MNIDIDLITFLLGLLLIVSLAGFGFGSSSFFKGGSRAISNLPPGPWKLPLIGNIHQLVGNLPHRTFSDLAKKYGPLMHLKIGELSLVIVSSPEIAKQVMDTHDTNFANRANNIASKILSYDGKNIAFSPYGEYWGRLRRICNSELLTPKRVQAFRSIREEQTSNLIKWIASNEGKSINLTEKVYSMLYTTTAIAAFGKKNEDQESFQKLTAQVIKIAAGFSIVDIFPSLKLLHSFSGGFKLTLEKQHLEIGSILQKIINDHKTAKKTGADNTKDFVDVLLNHGDENADIRLTDDNIKAVLLDIFTGGSETTATTIDWAMSEMMKNPRILRRAQEEVREAFGSDGYVDEKNIENLKYVRAIIKETLRLHPAAPLLLPRLNNQRVEINGYEIPAKTTVLVNAWAINRDPNYWQDGECFQPERFLESSIDYKGRHFEYIPFGAGRRICPGIQFGWAVVQLPIVQFLYYFDWELAGGIKCQELNMKEQLGMTTRRKENLYLIPTIRNTFPQ